MATVFQDKEVEYLQWLTDHPSGYVVSLEKTSTPRNVVLHRASCGTISTVRPSRGGMPKPGVFTERGYIKLCGDTVSDVRAAVKKYLKDDNANFSKHCQKCNPD